MKQQQRPKKGTGNPGLSDPRDQNREQYNPLFSGPDEATPQPVTPPYKKMPEASENGDEEATRTSSR
jgi:hypothetical protein